MDAELAGWI